MTAIKNEKTHTRFGTPLGSTWDDNWSALVEDTERRLNRRICGAHTIDGPPCTLFSEHRTGRCRFHGGNDSIGTYLGNRHARIHGLFARRLQDCAPHCPRFERCPLAAPDIAALPATDRPICLYESLEYDTTVEDLTLRSSTDPYDTQYAHHIALLQVMVGRAARALAAANTPSTLEAYLRISAEYRLALRLARTPAKGAAEPPKEIGLADALRPLLKRADGVLDEALEYERKKQARKAAKMRALQLSAPSSEADSAGAG
jgi:hypothetical protein